MPRQRDGIDRRQFLGRMAAAGIVAASSPRDGPKSMEGLALVRDPNDAIASSPAARCAADVLRRSCESRGITTRTCGRMAEVRAGELCVVVGGGPGGTKESLSLTPAAQGRPALLATAADSLGLAYALTELADQVAHAADPRQALRAAGKVTARPTCRIRSVMRLFVSDVEDKGWFHDRSFWPPYLDMLVTHRFNRFNLAVGLGYDFARQLRDTYFYFPYPFLLPVAGYDVRAVGLSDAERDRNLDTLRFVSEEAVRRGLHFQLGLWTHAFEWADSPQVNYTISGLTRENQAAYCRDAVQALLQACPAIMGLTIRTHGESGVPEGDESRYQFWQTLFSGIVRTGRPIEIDLHAKGVDQRILDVALATGLPVRVSPKFWAEHMGLPYLQSSIRALELPKAEPSGDSLMALSDGTRSHMRYSYGDLLTKDRRYGILHRVWPGTQRLLLWGDPAYAAQMGRTFSGLGADGVEFMEPLSFKGRKGSGLAGGRDAYRDASLRAPSGDWRKYEYTYRLWGRLAYDPDSDPEAWRRPLRRDFGAAATAVESGLARSSRILPLITSAHCPSAANNNYWPEIYSNMSMVDAGNRGSYSDTPTPKVFGPVSSLDPQLFASVDEAVDSLLQSKPSSKVTPAEVAVQLDEWADAATSDFAKAAAQIADPSDPRYRRIAVDSAIAVGLGRFFARKLRAGLLFGIFDRTGDVRARDESLDEYRQARGAWAAITENAAKAYVDDITFGFDAHLRGHWQDRLPAIDRDIAAIAAREARGDKKIVAPEVVARSIAAVREPPRRPIAALEHEAVRSFAPGRGLTLVVRGPADTTSVRLQYRHLNQAETYRAAEMERRGDSWRATVPAEYTHSPYALQYYFEVRSGAGIALWPGFGSDFTGTPYVVSEPSS